MISYLPSKDGCIISEEPLGRIETEDANTTESGQPKFDEGFGSSANIPQVFSISPGQPPEKKKREEDEQLRC